MTTIACDGEMIAGDGLVTGDGIIHDFDFEKVVKLSSGLIVGFAGSPYQKHAMIAFLEGETRSLDLDDSFEAILLHPSGLCECLNHKGQRYPQSAPCVTGSGSKLAMGAMLAGLDAREAVEVAILRDTDSGGTIKHYRRPA